jgi:hypothetical protein
MKIEMKIKLAVDFAEVRYQGTTRSVDKICLQLKTIAKKKDI